MVNDHTKLLSKSPAKRNPNVESTISMIQRTLKHNMVTAIAKVEHLEFLDKRYKHTLKGRATKSQDQNNTSIMMHREQASPATYLNQSNLSNVSTHTPVKRIPPSKFDSIRNTLLKRKSGSVVRAQPKLLFGQEHERKETKKTVQVMPQRPAPRQTIEDSYYEDEHSEYEQESFRSNSTPQVTAQRKQSSLFNPAAEEEETEEDIGAPVTSNPYSSIFNDASTIQITEEEEEEPEPPKMQPLRNVKSMSSFTDFHEQEQAKSKKVTDDKKVTDSIFEVPVNTPKEKPKEQPTKGISFMDQPVNKKKSAVVEQPKPITNQMSPQKEQKSVEEERIDRTKLASLTEKRLQQQKPNIEFNVPAVSQPKEEKKTTGFTADFGQSAAGSAFTFGETSTPTTDTSAFGFTPDKGKEKPKEEPKQELSFSFNGTQDKAKEKEQSAPAWGNPFAALSVETKPKETKKELSFQFGVAPQGSPELSVSAPTVEEPAETSFSFPLDKTQDTKQGDISFGGTNEFAKQPEEGNSFLNTSMNFSGFNSPSADTSNQFPSVSTASQPAPEPISFPGFNTQSGYATGGFPPQETAPISFGNQEKPPLSFITQDTKPLSFNTQPLSFVQAKQETPFTPPAQSASSFSFNNDFANAMTDTTTPSSSVIFQDTFPNTGGGNTTAFSSSSGGGGFFEEAPVGASLLSSTGNQLSEAFSFNGGGNSTVNFNTLLSSTTTQPNTGFLSGPSSGSTGGFGTGGAGGFGSGTGFNLSLSGNDQTTGASFGQTSFASGPSNAGPALGGSGAFGGFSTGGGFSGMSALTGGTNDAFGQGANSNLFNNTSSTASFTQMRK
jgi:hypothetical protein